MEGSSLLERMGRELKCPICLSLLRSAASLSCNHVFCNQCIKQSMKAGLYCPVCKVPYQRREMRPTPHMDNLVSIYKSIEAASGISIFATQNATSTNSTDGGKYANSESSPCTERKVKPGNNKQRTITKKFMKSSELDVKSSDHNSKPSFATNKRIQVPECTLQHVKVQLTGSRAENTEGINCMPNERFAIQCDHTFLDEKKEPHFAPFFWLREDEDLGKSSQTTEVNSSSDISPVKAPAFSDIKDSDDDIPSESAPKGDLRNKFNEVHCFDSEVFEWSQRALSPDLISTPVKMQVEDGNESDEILKGIFESWSNEEVEKKKPTIKSPYVNHKENKILDDEVVRFLYETEKDVNPCRSKRSRKRNLSNRESGEVLQFNKLSGRVSDISFNRGTEMIGIKKHGGNSEIGGITLEADGTLQVSNSLSGRSLMPSAIVDENGNVGNSVILYETQECSQGDEVPSVAETMDRVEQSSGTGTVDCRTKPKNCDTYFSSTQCAFCHSTEETEAFGQMVHYLNGKPVPAEYEGGFNIIHSHKSCAEWAPNVYFEGDAAVNLEAELARSRRIKCFMCGDKGAALGCFNSTCRRSFHVPCAKMVRQCQWDNDNFLMLCPLHSSSKLSGKVIDSKAKRRKSKLKGQLHTKQSPACVNHETNLWGSRGKSDNLILCCSALTKSEKEAVSMFERMSHCTVLKQWDPSVTHVVTSTSENSACRRTFKVLMGILEGRWIVTVEWIRACINQRGQVDEASYEIHKDIRGIENGPRLGRLRLLNKKPKLFMGFMFYLCGDFGPSYKGYIQGLIAAAGGTVLHRRPVSQVEDFSLASLISTNIIVYNLELPDDCQPENSDQILNKRKSEAEALALLTGSKLATNVWIVNCIAGYRLLELEY